VLTWFKNTEDNGDLRPSTNRVGGRAGGFFSQTLPEESSHLQTMSPEDYTDAVEHVAAQLTQDEFVTNFERISLAAQGFEYRLKQRAGAGTTPIVFVHADLDAGRASGAIVWICYVGDASIRLCPEVYR
jgi:hypothetical protein